MKIAYITSSLEGGGAGLPIPTVTRVLRNKGMHVEIFALTRRDGRALKGMYADNLRVHIREGGDKDHRAAYKWLRDEMIEYQPTVIWTSIARASIIGLLLGRRLSIPVVCWQHCAYLKPLTHWLYYFLRKQAILWIGDSNIVSSITAKRFALRSDQIATWPLFAAKPNAPQSRPWQQGQVLRIGSLGRLHSHKSYDVLIGSLALLKQRGFVSPTKFEIVIAGDGPDHDALVKAALQAGCSEIKFRDFVEQPQEFLADRHLYLQPSNKEGFCIAVHEAMQAGLPIIASAVGQIPLSVEAGLNGWLVPPGDVEALANALTKALSHPEKLSAMGKASRDRVLPLYSTKSFREAGENILERLAEKLCTKLTLSPEKF